MKELQYLNNIELDKNNLSPDSMFAKAIRLNRLKQICQICLLIAGVLISLYTLPNQAYSTANQAVAGPFRLHVIANSNSSYDQQLKLMVRDAVVEYLTPKLVGVTETKAAEQIVISSIDDLTEIANGIIQDTDYTAESMVGYFDFPAKKYGELTIPAGEYHALKIVLGEGKGNNWWCVLFPPLCFVDEAGKLEETEKTEAMDTTEKNNVKTQLMSNPTPEQMFNISQNGLQQQTQIKIKLKLNEIFYIQK